MPGDDFIPRKDDVFLAWLRGYVAYVQAHAVELSVPPGKVAEQAANLAAMEAAYQEHLRLHAAAKGAFETKTRQRKTSERSARSLAQMIQARPETTDAQREGLGLRVPDRIRTPTPPERIREIPGPLVLPDWSQRGQVAVHAGPNPGNEHANALPEGVWAIQIHARIGEAPEVFLVTITRSPFIHLLPVGAPATVTYRARYLDRQGREGPFGDPVSCTVSV